MVKGRAGVDPQYWMWVLENLVTFVQTLYLNRESFEYIKIWVRNDQYQEIVGSNKWELFKWLSIERKTLLAPGKRGGRGVIFSILVRLFNYYYLYIILRLLGGHKFRIMNPWFRGVGGGGGVYIFNASSFIRLLLVLRLLKVQV